MESWVPVLASALKTSLGDVNVIVTDWLLQANMNSPNAAQNTRAVGKDVAFLPQWLQVRVRKVFNVFNKDCHSKVLFV